MKLLIAGSRNFCSEENYNLLCSEVEKLEFSSIISGGAKGADTLAERYAFERNIPIEIIKPEWEKFGKKAGFIRNELMWEMCDFGIVFWDGRSKGTKHSLDLSRDYNKKLIVNIYTTNEKMVLNNTINDF